jgi:hypothetical protein
MVINRLKRPVSLVCLHLWAGQHRLATCRPMQFRHYRHISWAKVGVGWENAHFVCTQAIQLIPAMSETIRSNAVCYTGTRKRRLQFAFCGFEGMNRQFTRSSPVFKFSPVQPNSGQ